MRDKDRGGPDQPNRGKEWVMVFAEVKTALAMSHFEQAKALRAEADRMNGWGLGEGSVLLYAIAKSHEAAMTRLLEDSDERAAA